MSDIYNRLKRSEIMSGISGIETKPEILVRRYLFANGFRYRKNVKKLPGKPDIVFSKYKTVIFVHGCFWHGHNCGRATRPKTNTEFWNAKIQGNINRDEKTKAELEKLGWRTVILWTCKLKNKDKFKSTMKELLGILNSDISKLNITH
ncbi:MAG: DNA mismatch endonuclease Vsr [Bacteroidales bacterium]|nr:DNA mismatch endonuclease Vsr [Bacteroidales bacterium]